MSRRLCSPMAASVALHEMVRPPACAKYWPRDGVGSNPSGRRASRDSGIRAAPSATALSTKTSTRFIDAPPRIAGLYHVIHPLPRKSRRFMLGFLLECSGTAWRTHFVHAASCRRLPHPKIARAFTRRRTLHARVDQSYGRITDLV